MTISDRDLKLLWGRAAGICSNPACQADLTATPQRGRAYIVGEMAHVIAQQPKGPRGNGVGGDDSYENLILLCPTCHTHVDKESEGHSESTLEKWKFDHEAAIRSLKFSNKFTSRGTLITYVRHLLSENEVIWATLGPTSPIARANPESNAHLLWELRKVDRVIPNNKKILDALDVNRHLMDRRMMNAAAEFRLHADGFEQNQYGRLDYYPLFPKSFQEAFE